MVPKAIVADRRKTCTLHVNKSVYNRYRSSTHKPTSKSYDEVQVEACNLLEELMRELQEEQYHTLALKIDIEGGEFPLLDTVKEWMAALKIQVPTLSRIKMMLEYSLDVEPEISKLLRRRNLCEDVFDTVTTKRKFLQRDSSKVHKAQSADNADLWLCDWKRKTPYEVN